MKIINQALAKMKPGPMVQDHKFSPPTRGDEAVDGSAHPCFKLIRGYPCLGATYTVTEARVSLDYLVSDGSNRPYRARLSDRIRLPAGNRYYDETAHASGRLAIIGSLDVVFGEIDR